MGPETVLAHRATLLLLGLLPAAATASRSGPRTRTRTGTTGHASSLPLMPVTDAVINAAPMEPTPEELLWGDTRHDANTLSALLRRPPSTRDMTRRRIGSALGDVVTTGYAYGDGNRLFRALEQLVQDLLGGSWTHVSLRAAVITAATDPNSEWRARLENDILATGETWEQWLARVGDVGQDGDMFALIILREILGVPIVWVTEGAGRRTLLWARAEDAEEWTGGARHWVVALVVSEATTRPCSVSCAQGLLDKWRTGISCWRRGKWAVVVGLP